MKNNSYSMQSNFVTENPFIVGRDNRYTAIKCPNCKDGLLFIKYFNTSGQFVCNCGFVLK